MNALMKCAAHADATDHNNKRASGTTWQQEEDVL